MKYAELAKAAREMSAEVKAANLRSLANDPRFAAVVALIEDARLDFQRAFADQKIAAHHGPLAHCAGTFYALDYLEGQVRQQTDQGKAKGSRTMAEGEE